MRTFRIAFVLAFAWCLSAAAQDAARVRAPVSPMAHARHTFTLTPLGNGNLLAAGGAGENGWLRSCEIYHAETGTWRPAGDLIEPRHGHTATRLGDGRVLVAGSWTGGYSASAELFDPHTGIWKPAATMRHPRDRHTATLLPDGRILIAGGFSDDGALASVEVYDPVADTWTDWPDLPRPTAYHTATPLTPDTILFAGGEGHQENYAYATLFDRASRTFTQLADTAVPHAYGQTATLLTDRTVLIVGGEPNEPGPGRPALALVERFNPATRQWSASDPMKIPRYFHSATLLTDGRLLVAGGMTRAEPNAPQASSEIFDPAANTWRDSPRMSVGRARHCAVSLHDGAVLIAGGHGATGAPLNSVDILAP